MKIIPRLVDGTLPVRLFDLMEPTATIVGGLGAWAQWIGPGMQWETVAEFCAWVKTGNQ